MTISKSFGGDNAMTRTKLSVLATVLTILTGSVAQATIYQAAGITTPNEAFPAVNAINQSGLSGGGYSSGVDDFDTTVAATTHTVVGGNHWAANSPIPSFPFNVDFDLGGTITFNSIVIWAMGTEPSGPHQFGHLDDIVNFDLFADDNAGFSSPTNLGSFTADPGGNGPNNATTGQVFSFASTTESHVRLVYQSNHGGAGRRLAEVAFGFSEAAAAAAGTPEPGTFALAVLGLAGLVALGWRRRR